MLAIRKIIPVRNFTPQRREIIIQKWLRQEFNMPDARREALVGEARGIITRSFLEQNFNEKTNSYIFNEKEISCLVKVFGEKVKAATLGKNPEYLRFRGALLASLTTGKFTRP